MLLMARLLSVHSEVHIAHRLHKEVPELCGEGVRAWEYYRDGI